MGRLLTVLKAIFLVTVSFAAITVGITVLQLRKTVIATDVVIQAIGNKTTQTLTNVNRLIVIAGAAASEAQKASADQRQFLKLVDNKVSKDLDDLALVESAATDALTQTAQTARAIQPVLATTQDAIAGLQPIELQLTESAKNANVLLTDPTIPKTLQSIQETAIHTDGAMAATEGTMLDVKKVADHYEVKLDAKTKWYIQVYHIVMAMAGLGYYTTNIK